MHVPHGDIHTDGLFDDCPGCAEIAENPIREADSRLLKQLVELAADRERLVKGRSETELIASAKILTHLERTGRVCEVAGDVVATYLNERWHLGAEINPRPCPFCKGAKVLDNAVYGIVACRVCLGTGRPEAYDDDLGHDAHPRELRRIAELLYRNEHIGIAVDATPEPPVSVDMKERVGRVLDLGAAVVVLREAGTERERIHELVDVACDEHESP